MGASTNGIVCFGIAFEEGEEFPWGDEFEIDDWWRELNGYDNPTPDPFADDGDSDDIDKWMEYRDQWDAEHPCPVTVVNYCSGEYPMYILAIPDTVVVAKRGYPEPINQKFFTCEPSWPDVLVDFCKKHNIPRDSNPKWLLCSYKD